MGLGLVGLVGSWIDGGEGEVGMEWIGRSDLEPLAGAAHTFLMFSPLQPIHPPTHRIAPSSPSVGTAPLPSPTSASSLGEQRHDAWAGRHENASP